MRTPRHHQDTDLRGVQAEAHIGIHRQKPPDDADAGRVGEAKAEKTDDHRITENGAPTGRLAFLLPSHLVQPWGQQHQRTGEADEGQQPHADEGAVQSQTVMEDPAGHRPQTQPQQQGHVEQSHGIALPAFGG